MRCDAAGEVGLVKPLRAIFGSCDVNVAIIMLLAIRVLVVSLKIATEGVLLHGDLVSLEGCDDLFKRANDRIERLNAETGLAGQLEAAMTSNSCTKSAPRISR